MTFETVIGLEVHAQLRTKTKIFCGCGTEFGRPPNTQTCPVCLGLPGSLPVINKRAVEMAVRAGLALNCSIRSTNIFARKNYFYPDLPKGYQISQYEEPICEWGWIDLNVNESTKRVRIRRAHLEEDAGKNIHAGEGSYSFVDLNRAGTPLLEIVTEPDMHSADEVVAYLKSLRDVLVYLDVCDGNMEQGSMRCEPNISLRPAGSETFGTKVELKNINSFKFVKDATEYEIKRQTKVLTEGGTIHQETRLWNIELGQTAVMRSKEEAHDYRYFPDPDLLPLSISDEWIEELRSTLQELPQAKQQRFITQYGLPEYDAGVLISDKKRAELFEKTVLEFSSDPKKTSNFMMNNLMGKEDLISPASIADILDLVENETASITVAKTILLPEVLASPDNPKPARQILREKGLEQVSDEEALEQMIEEVLEKNPAQVGQYRGGKETVLGFFVGQVMKASKGKANPKKVNELLKRALSS